MQKKDVYLESIRGLAAMVVVFHHLVLAFIPALKSGFYTIQTTHGVAFRLLGNSPLSVITNGPYAVRLFFLLSGFVLSISYFKKKQLSLLSSVAIRRYPRLMIPVLASVLFAWVIQELPGYHNGVAASLMQQRPDSYLNSYYLQHVSFIQALKQGLFGTFFRFDWSTTLNVPLWTMSIELAGSFFVFSFLALVGLLYRRSAIYLVLAMIFIHLKNYYALDFLAGIALCDLHIVLENSSTRKMQLSAWMAWTILLIGLALGGLSPSFFWYYTHLNARGVDIWPTLASLFIVGSAVFCPHLQKSLQHPILAFLGRISFQLYLYHNVILFSLGCWIYVHLRADAYSHLTSVGISSLITLATSLLVAWGAYYAADLPSIGIGHKLTSFFNVPSTVARTKP